MSTSSNLARARIVAESVFAKIEAECDKHGGLAPAYSVRIATPDITNALDAAEQRGRATGRREGLEEVTAERDRLRDILACERGERAPEGWLWCDGEWVKGNAYVASGVSSGWRRGHMRAGTPYVEAHYTYALEAIEAADRAAKECE